MLRPAKGNPMPDLFHRNLNDRPRLAELRPPPSNGPFLDRIEHTARQPHSFDNARTGIQNFLTENEMNIPRTRSNRPGGSPEKHNQDTGMPRGLSRPPSPSSQRSPERPLSPRLDSALSPSLLAAPSSPNPPHIQAHSQFDPFSLPDLDPPSRESSPKEESPSREIYDQIHDEYLSLLEQPSSSKSVNESSSASVQSTQSGPYPAAYPPQRPMQSSSHEPSASTLTKRRPGRYRTQSLYVRERVHSSGKVRYEAESRFPKFAGERKRVRVGTFDTEAEAREAVAKHRIANNLPPDRPLSSAELKEYRARRSHQGLHAEADSIQDLEPPLHGRRE